MPTSPPAAGGGGGSGGPSCREGTEEQAWMMDMEARRRQRRRREREREGGNRTRPAPPTPSSGSGTPSTRRPLHLLHLLPGDGGGPGGRSFWSPPGTSSARAATSPFLTWPRSSGRCAPMPRWGTPLSSWGKREGGGNPFAAAADPRPPASREVCTARTTITTTGATTGGPRWGTGS